MAQTKAELLERHSFVHNPEHLGPTYNAQSEMAEILPKSPLKDAEIVFAFLARVIEKLDDIYQTQVEQGFTIDFYGDNAGTGGATAIIGSQNQGLYKTYNGPYLITTILATWGSAATAVTLQLGDRTLQLLPTPGLFNPQGLQIEMARDDPIVLTVTPGTVACHLEIMGNVKKRTREKSE